MTPECNRSSNSADMDHCVAPEVDTIKHLESLSDEEFEALTARLRQALANHVEIFEETE